MEKISFLTIQDVKERLNVSRQAILNLITSGELKAVHVGRVWRISTVAFRNYLISIGAEEVLEAEAGNEA